MKARGPILGGVFGAVLLAGAAPAAWASTGATLSPVGVWATAGELSHIDVEPCGQALCGKVVWLKEPLDQKTGKPKTDIFNKDPALRGRPILGMMLMSGFVKGSDAGEWDHGVIYNPRDGDTYRCTMRLDDADHMTVRGYVGVPLFGKSEHWVRVK